MRSNGNAPMRHLMALLMILVLVPLSGCTSSGGLKNGAIMGSLRLMGKDGMPTDQDLPGVSVRADAYNAGPQEGWFSRTAIIDSSTGKYVIDDVPVGTYNLRLIAPNYSDGFAYVLQIWDGFPSTTDGTIPPTGGAAVAPKMVSPWTQGVAVRVDSLEPASELPETKGLMKWTGGGTTATTALPTIAQQGDVIAASNAIVESGRTYEMPTLYLTKSNTIPSNGSVRGTLINVLTSAPIAGAVISLTDSQNASYTAVTSATGTFSIADIYPGRAQVTAEKSGHQFLPNGNTATPNQPQTVTIPEGRRVDLELYMTPGTATLAGMIEAAFPMDAADWQGVNIAVDGIALAAADIGGTRPNFTIRVPAGLNSYVVKIFGDNILTDASDIVPGPLKVGSTTQVTGLKATLKTSSVKVKAVTTMADSAMPSEPVTITVFTDKGQSGEIIFPGKSATSSTVTLKNVPYGERTIKTRGAGLISATMQDAEETIQIFSDTSVTLILSGGAAP